MRERLSFHNAATEVSDIKAQADAQERGVVLPLSQSKERLGKRRSPSTVRPVSDSSVPQATDFSRIENSREERSADFDFSEFEDANHQIAALEIQIRELRRRGDNWQKAAQAAALGQQKLHALAADVEKLRDERESAVTKAKASQAAFDDASKQLAALRGDLNTLRKERDAWENEARDARAAAEDARQRSVALSTELDTFRDERERLAGTAVSEAADADLQEHES
jgi:predicted  nucleic acid-binding Zn-ribbon protein